MLYLIKQNFYLEKATKPLKVSFAIQLLQMPFLFYYKKIKK